MIESDNGLWHHAGGIASGTSLEGYKTLTGRSKQLRGNGKTQCGNQIAKESKESLGNAQHLSDTYLWCN